MPFPANAQKVGMLHGDRDRLGGEVGPRRSVNKGLLSSALVVDLFFQFPGEALAIQTHGGTEGLYTHQLGHVLFLVAMVVLYVRLRRLVEWTSRGWRLIGASCLLFAMWNAVAFLGHWLEESRPTLSFTGGATPWSRALVATPYWEGLLFYVCKLDHLLAAPAMLLFLLGLRALDKERP